MARSVKMRALAAYLTPAALKRLTGALNMSEGDIKAAVRCQNMAVCFAIGKELGIHVVPLNDWVQKWRRREDNKKT